MELAAWWLALDSWAVEVEILDSIFEVDEDYVIEHLEAVPASKYHDFAVVELCGVAHARLGLPVDRRDRPLQFLHVQDMDIIDHFAASVALSAPENDQIMSE